MKRILSLLLAAVLLAAMLAGCAKAPEQSAEEDAGIHVCDDGRARPSNSGRLQVAGGKLSDREGKPVMLRGVSFNGLITSESFLNEQLFEELSRDVGVNVVRLSMYTHGVGVMGYCTKGDRARYEADIDKGVTLATAHDMYAIIDWHILSDGDPNIYVDQAKDFFARMADKYGDHNNVLYEICNEPNGVDWPTVRAYAEQVIPIIRERAPKAVIIVGNPQWSSDLKSVLADPLDVENVLYTLHFYAASHGEDSRKAVEEASQQGLPIFVTEYGVTAATGGFPRDLDSADLWIELLEREGISYCMWTFSKAAEPCSAVRSTVPKYNGFVEEDYTATGLWLLKTLAKYNTK